MYFGSVRFFKHAILTTVALAILVPSGLAIYFYQQQNTLQNTVVELNTYQERLVTQQQQLPTQQYEALSYQALFPDMTVGEKPPFSDNAKEKKVYLTFDDGPSKRTLEILDILDAHEIKGTFFVIYQDDTFSKSVLREIVDRGHTIGVHSGSHEYKQIYQSVTAFLEDFYRTYALIKETTGIEVSLFRFPGGSINSYNQGVYQEIIAEMLRRGFIYHDWNVSSGDAEKSPTVVKVFSETVNRTIQGNKAIVLMHDSVQKTYTVEALSGIIETLKEYGYQFAPLDATVKPYVFQYIS